VPQLEGVLLDLHAYDQVEELDRTSKGHSHLDKTISTLSIPLPALTKGQLEAVDAWLRSVLWDNVLPSDEKTDQTAFEIHRLKGRLVLGDGKEKMIQGVRELFEIFDKPNPDPEASLESKRDAGKMVIIGRHLDKYDFERSLLEAFKKAV
jgi:hypothetical protein